MPVKGPEEEEAGGGEQNAESAETEISPRSWSDVHPAAKPFVAIWRTIRDWWRELLVLTVTCFGWLVLSVTIIGWPPATTALYAMARATVLHEHPDLQLFVTSLRAYFGKSWRLGAIGLLGTLLWFLDLSLYLAMAGELGGLAWIGAVLILYIGVVWVQTLFFAWPMLVCRDDLAVRHLLRNGAILAMRYPVHNLIMTLFGGFLLWLTVFYAPPLIALATPALLALLGLHNLYLLAPELAPDDIEVLHVVG